MFIKKFMSLVPVVFSLALVINFLTSRDIGIIL